MGKQIGLLPMQWCYLSTQDPHDRAVPVTLYWVSPSFSPEMIEEALRALWAHHDALRVRFERDPAGTWRQILDPDRPDADRLTLVDVSALTHEQIEGATGRIITENLKGFRIDEGELFRPLLFERRADEPRLLALVSHHLINDLWSDFVLTRDLARVTKRLAATGSPTLGPRTTDVASWAAALEAMGEGGAFEDEAPFWREAVAPPDPMQLLAEPAARFEASFTLDEPVTHALCYEAPGALGASLEDVLVAATGIALARWCAAKDVAFNWLDAGRSDLPPGNDLSRTVGLLLRDWPRWLHVHPGASVRDVLPAVREQRERPRHRGLGFDVLTLYGRDRALRAELLRHPALTVRANWVGGLKKLVDLTDDAQFRRIRPPWALHGRADTPGALEIVLAVRDARLRGFIGLRTSNAERVAQLRDAFVEVLEGIIR